MEGQKSTVVANPHGECRKSLHNTARCGSHDFMHTFTDGLQFAFIIGNSIVAGKSPIDHLLHLVLSLDTNNHHPLNVEPYSPTFVGRRPELVGGVSHDRERTVRNLALPSRERVQAIQVGVEIYNSSPPIINWD